ncbi:MAG TPA: DNA ligase D [Gemmatimonadales bacterium]|nr:DNA ligase D [Gemmatimonadales bacterium]
MAATDEGTTDPLSTYRAKRSVEGTPEPSGAVGRERGSLFVVHKHAARRLHYDLRLEMEGVLRSWAVPKGPSFDQQDKRLAVHVEDHPIEYGDFEGRIPEGNYGAGAVIIWDRGVWIPLEDPLEGLKKGKLLFELRGYKLKGAWTLVKIKKSEKDWLLIKERDAYQVAGGVEVPEVSVMSGLSVDDLASGRDPAAPITQELVQLGAPQQRVDAAAVEVMLAETSDTPFTKPDWVFELKLDGYRIVAGLDQGAAMLRTRAGRDTTDSFPEIARAVAALPFRRLVLDGEVVALDAEGRPSFQRLQQRARLTRPLDVKRAAVAIPATYFVFDLLGFEDFDLRPLPLEVRKSLLRRILPPVGPLPFVDHIAEQGDAVFAQVRKLGLEGIVAKRADAPYQGGRSSAWLKVRSDRTDDFVVVGYTAPKGSRGGFGALHVADYVDGTLVYGGRVGSGFSQDQLTEIAPELEARSRPDAPCVGPLPQDRGTTWVEPDLVCEVRYKEWTDEGLLRQPVFIQFRDDKPMEECVRQAGRPRLEEPAAVQHAGPVDRVVRFSNLEKVFWPDEGYAKGDLIDYYRTVAPWLLPYLKNRPVVLTRYPDGITGKSFYQKDAPKFIPDWLRTERMWSEQAQREIDYFICDDEASLLYLINLGTIPLHLWASRADALERPDWCILDLDPKEAPFIHVVTVAQAIHRLCEAISLPHFVKTSGSSGLHVLLPMGRQVTNEQARSFGELFANIVVAELPDIATVVRNPARREGKVYVDFLQNGHGRTIAAPYSARPLPGAPVSAPLAWEEVTPDLRILDYTIQTMPRRLAAMADDPLLPVIRLQPDLANIVSGVQAYAASLELG